MPKKWTIPAPIITPAPPVDPLITAKLEAVKRVVQNLTPITNFSAIAKQIGKSRQFVSKRMQERFKGNTAAMWNRGGDWYVPVATAELWLREFFLEHP